MGHGTSGLPLESRTDADLGDDNCVAGCRLSQPVQWVNKTVLVTEARVGEPSCADRLRSE
jgi:hypothetical protein